MTKKTIVPFLLMIAGTAVLGFYTPWWTGSVWVILIAGLNRLSVKNNMFIGGLAIGLVWLVMAGIMSLQDEAGIISKTGALLGGLSHQLMIIITVLIALITGVLSGWLGSVLGSLLHRKTTND